MSAEDREDDIERLLSLAGARPLAPAGTRDRVHDEVRTRWRHAVAARRRRKLGFWTAGLAAAAAAVVLSGLALRRLEPASGSAGAAGGATLIRLAGSLRMEPAMAQPVQSGVAIPDDTALETGPDDRAALLLSDGTALRLDRDTRIRLRPGPRIELNRGALYAETAEPARADRTLRIDTGFGTVRDVGTRFQVRLTGDRLEVTVRSGVARLERGSASHEAGSGTRLVADAAGAVTVESAPVHGAQWDWTLQVAPEFDLEGRTLGEFLDWAAGEYGLRIEFEDPAVKPRAVATVLHGSVHGMNPDEALAAVLPTCGLSHSVGDGVLRIEAVSR